MNFFGDFTGVIENVVPLQPTLRGKQAAALGLDYHNLNRYQTYDHAQAVPNGATPQMGRESNYIRYDTDPAAVVDTRGQVLGGGVDPRDISEKLADHEVTFLGVEDRTGINDWQSPDAPDPSWIPLAGSFQPGHVLERYRDTHPHNRVLGYRSGVTRAPIPVGNRTARKVHGKQVYGTHVRNVLSEVGTSKQSSVAPGVDTDYTLSVASEDVDYNGTIRPEVMVFEDAIPGPVGSVVAPWNAGLRVPDTGGAGIVRGQSNPQAGLIKEHQIHVRWSGEDTRFYVESYPTSVLGDVTRRESGNSAAYLDAAAAAALPWGQSIRGVKDVEHSTNLRFGYNLMGPSNAFPQFYQQPKGLAKDITTRQDYDIDITDRLDPGVFYGCGAGCIILRDGATAGSKEILLVDQRFDTNSLRGAQGYLAQGAPRAPHNISVPFGKNGRYVAGLGLTEDLAHTALRETIEELFCMHARVAWSLEDLLNGKYGKYDTAAPAGLADEIRGFYDAAVANIRGCVSIENNLFVIIDMQAQVTAFQPGGYAPINPLNHNDSECDPAGWGGWHPLGFLTQLVDVHATPTAADVALAALPFVDRHVGNSSLWSDPQVQVPIAATVRSLTLQAAIAAMIYVTGNIS